MRRTPLTTTPRRQQVTSVCSILSLEDESDTAGRKWSSARRALKLQRTAIVKVGRHLTRTVTRTHTRLQKYC